MMRGRIRILLVVSGLVVACALVTGVYVADGRKG